MSDTKSSTDRMKELKLLGYSPASSAGARADALVSNLLQIEEFQAEFEEFLPAAGGVRRRALDLFARERTQNEATLLEWIEGAGDFQIAAVYYQCHQLTVRDKPVGFLFAQFLCEDEKIGPERLLQIIDLLPEGEAREHLERIAAELSERGGG